MSERIITSVNRVLLYELPRAFSSLRSVTEPMAFPSLHWSVFTALMVGSVPLTLTTSVQPPPRVVMSQYTWQVPTVPYSVCMPEVVTPPAFNSLQEVAPAI